MHTFLQTKSFLEMSRITHLQKMRTLVPKKIMQGKIAGKKSLTLQTFVQEKKVCARDFIEKKNARKILTKSNSYNLGIPRPVTFLMVHPLCTVINVLERRKHALWNNDSALSPVLCTLIRACILLSWDEPAELSQGKLVSTDLWSKEPELDQTSQSFLIE